MLRYDRRRWNSCSIPPIRQWSRGPSARSWLIIREFRYDLKLIKWIFANRNGSICDAFFIHNCKHIRLNYVNRCNWKLQIRTGVNNLSFMSLKKLQIIWSSVFLCQFSIRSAVVNKVAEYLIYKDNYETNLADAPKFMVEPSMVLEILLASNFLDIW